MLVQELGADKVLGSKYFLRVLQNNCVCQTLGSPEIFKGLFVIVNHYLICHSYKTFYEI